MGTIERDEEPPLKKLVVTDEYLEFEVADGKEPWDPKHPKDPRDRSS